MMIKTVTEGKTRVLIAGALALLTQGAWADDGEAARQAPAEVKVSMPNQPIVIAETKLENDASEHIEALNRYLAAELEASLEAIRISRVELVLAEVPTRG